MGLIFSYGLFPFLKAADRLDAAKAAIPKEKKLVRERTFDEATGKGKTRLHFEEQEKPIGRNKPHNNPLSRPAQEAGSFVHNKIHSVEKDNSGVEGAHKSEERAERGAKYGTRKVKEGYRSHKLKPYRAAAKAEKTAFKANVDFQRNKKLLRTMQRPQRYGRSVFMNHFIKTRTHYKIAVSYTHLDVYKRQYQCIFFRNDGRWMGLGPYARMAA